MIKYSLLVLTSLLYASALMSNHQNKENHGIITTIDAYKQSTQQLEKVPQPTEKLNINQQIQEYFSIAEEYRWSTHFDPAITYYKKVLELAADHFESCFNLGNIYYNRNEIETAFNYYKKALNSNKKSPQLYFNAGLCLKQLKQSDKAIEYFEKAIQLKPNYSKAYLNLAKTLQEKKENKKAIEIYLTYLQHNPNDSTVYRHLGSAYRSLNQFEKAIETFRTAYALQPKDTTIMLELANTLTILNQLDEALGLYQKVLLIKPTTTAAFYNISYVLKRQGYVKEAIELLQKIIEKNPNHAQAHFSLGLSYLTLGNFEDGWQEYEWRWETHGKTPNKFSKPLWDGSNLQNKTILICAEQGLGDTFQFIRYAQSIKRMGATILFQSQSPLINILSLCDYLDFVISRDKQLPDFDFHVPLMTLPLIFKTHEETIPAEIPYLHADPKLVEYWKEKLSADKNFKIGLCWQGNANYSTQFLRQVVAAKSISVKLFEPLSQVPGISLYSLQKIHGTNQLKELDGSLVIYDFGPDFDTTNGRFMDTAAIIKNLNLVITVDTSICHLSAALGTPTWIMLPEPSDWRWMLNRTDTPWYPNARLFRQPSPGDWKNVIQQIVQALYALLRPSQTDNSILEGISDLGRHEHQTIQQINNQKTTKDFSLLPIDEFIDKMTWITINTNQQEDSTSNVQTMHLLYSNYLKQWPSLKELTQQLLYANRYLLNLKKRLEEELEGDILDYPFAEIARKISRTSKFKKEIKKEIHQLIN